MATPKTISERAIERMSRYRRVLDELATGDSPSVYSHELASLCGLTAAQVRRDLMTIGFTGSSARGYDIAELNHSVSDFMGFSTERRMVLVGIGHLGRALLDFFVDRNPKLALVAAFDSDPTRVNRVIHGVRCYPVEELLDSVRSHNAQMGIITVPAQVAQEIAWTLVEAGVTGLLNFAPVQLRVPKGVHVENLDLTSVLEKVAYFSGVNAEKER